MVAYDPRTAFNREDHDFLSRGTRCSGWLYRPDGVTRPPVVVMAHGFGAQRDFAIPAYAERFAARGMAAFAFDYRSFGASDGEPRNLVNPWRHLQDWEAAVAYVRALQHVDGGRMALWGSSYSGGHVMVIASRDPGVSAIVSQVPFVDGITSAIKTGLRHAVESTVEALKDVARAATGRDPHYVPIVEEPGRFGIMNTPESKPGYLAIVPEGSEWRNECPARAVFELLAYRPISRARGVRCPALVIVGTRDSLIMPAMAERAASRMREVTLVHLDVGHFDVYAGAVFEEVVELESEFLSRRLGAG